MIYFGSNGRHKHNFILGVGEKESSQPYLREGKWVYLGEQNGHKVGCVIVDNDGGYYITLGTNNSIRNIIDTPELTNVR